MMPTTRRTETRLLTAVSYRPSTRSLSVVYDDGEIAEVAVDALKLPEEANIEDVRLDEFHRGVKFMLGDGTMHDVSADYITWLTDEAYRRQYPDENIGVRIGANITALRKQRGMSQGELARAADIQGPNLSRLESGKHVPTLDVLLRVAQALSVPLNKVVGASPGNSASAPNETYQRTDGGVDVQVTPQITKGQTMSTMPWLDACHGERVKMYRCKHAIEAMRWADTDDNREAFATWFEKHDAVFETRGPEVVFRDHHGEEWVVAEGDWILYSDREFIAMANESFTDDYEEVA